MQLQFPEDGEPKAGRKKRKTREALAYSDIDLSLWKEYPDVWTDSLWMVNARAKSGGHNLDYHGNFVPQIATQVMERFTKAGDIVLDLFLGSGTSAIEAINLNRRLVGVELNPKQVQIVRQKLGVEAPEQGIHVVCGDSSSRKTLRTIRKALDEMHAQSVQLLLLHPPYHDIIRFSEDQADLSNATSTKDFMRMFRKVAKVGWELLDPGRFAVVVIGDKYEKKELVPLGFMCMQEMNRVGFRTKSIVVKNITGNERGKGKDSNLWRYRALAGGFYIFKHEYILIMQKP